MSGRIRLMSICFFTHLLLLFSCQQIRETPGEANSQDISSVSISNDTGKKNQHRQIFNEFCIRKDNIELCLRDWKSYVHLGKLGVPKDTSTHILGEGADTHIGSRIQDYKYNDIRLRFFGPPDGKNVWLMNMEVTGKGWKTAKGLRTGDDHSKMNDLYPEATNQFSKDKNIYRFTNGSEAVMEFIISAGKVSKILIRYEIP